MEIILFSFSLTVMNEQSRVAGNSDEITVGEGFVGRVTGGRCVAKSSASAGHMIQRMLLLLLIGTLFMLAGVVVI